MTPCFLHTPNMTNKWNDFKPANNNTAKNDGYLYSGKGFNQLTFKGNYKKIGDLIGIDLISNPNKELDEVN